MLRLRDSFRRKGPTGEASGSNPEWPIRDLRCYHSFRSDTERCDRPEGKERNYLLSLFSLLIGGYSSVGRALPLQWCRRNDHLMIIFALLRGLSETKADRMSFLPDALPPFQIDGMGTIAWRLPACMNPFFERALCG
jgi:hypothetical protein